MILTYIIFSFFRISQLHEFIKRNSIEKLRNLKNFNPYLLDIHRQDEEGITILKRCLDFDNEYMFRYLFIELPSTDIWKEHLIFDKIARKSWGAKMMGEICTERLCRNPEYLNSLFNVLDIEQQKDLFVDSGFLCKKLGDKTFLEILESQGKINI